MANKRNSTKVVRSRNSGFAKEASLPFEKFLRPCQKCRGKSLWGQIRSALGVPFKVENKWNHLTFVFITDFNLCWQFLAIFLLHIHLLYERRITRAGGRVFCRSFLNRALCVVLRMGYRWYWKLYRIFSEYPNFYMLKLSRRFYSFSRFIVGLKTHGK